MSWPERVTDKQLRRKLPADAPKTLKLVLVGTAERGRMYKRDDDGDWYLLEEHSAATPMGEAPRPVH